jgi:hypothetical protein
MKIFLRVGLIAIVVLLLLLRFYKLDLDAAANNISGITTWDEPYYTYSAMYDLISSKPTFPQDLKANALMEIISIHSNLITKIGFFIAGNTFEGLRLGVVLISLLTILMLYKIAIQHFDFLDTQKTVNKLLILSLLLTEPTFFMFSRAQTPQIYSIFWITLVFYSVFQYIRSGRNVWITLAVALALLTVCFVYPYNVYVALALASYLLTEYIKSRQSKLLLFSFLGLILGVVIYTVILKLYGFGINDYFHFMKSFRAYRNESDLSNRTILSIAMAPLQIFYTNLLRYNPLFVLTLFSLPILFIRKAARPSFDNFILLVVGMAFLQSFGISSYPFKKWVTLFPTLFLTIPFLFRTIHIQIRDKKLIRYLLYALFFAMTLKTQLVVNTKEYWSGFDAWFIYQNPDVMIKWFPVLFALLIIILFELINRGINPKSLLVLIAICQTIIMFRINFYKQTNTYLTFLKDNAKYLDNKVVISDSEVYTLYNNGIVFYNYMSKQLNIDSEIVSKSDTYTFKERCLVRSYPPNLPPSDIINDGGNEYTLVKYTKGSIYSFAIYEQKK